MADSSFFFYCHVESVSFTYSIMLTRPQIRLINVFTLIESYFLERKTQLNDVRFVIRAKVAKAVTSD